MADHTQPLGLRLAALAAAGLVLALVFGTLAAVAFRAEFSGGLAPSDWAAVRFTVVQATLSAMFSIALAVPVARALARRSFPGRRWLITAFGAPFLLPVIVAVLGLLAVFGRNGVVNTLSGAAGLPPISIYGLHGVVLAHVFFNLPLATRLVLQGWLSVPAEEFRLAASLGLSSRQISRILELPMLRRVLPGAFIVVFLLCLTSFAVVLALGGGPKATTIELAIYHAFRFDFDLERAALLALLQVVIAGAAAGVALRFSRVAETGSGLDLVVTRWDGRGLAVRALDVCWLALAAIFLFAPMMAVLLSGLPALLGLPSSVWAAAGRSIAVAFASVGLCAALALPIALWVGQSVQQAGRFGGAGLVELAGYLSLAASPLVIGTGLFLILYRFVDPAALALPVTALVNALMALPFALRALVPAVEDTHMRFSRLADSLGLSGMARQRLVVLPRLRRPLGFALGLAGALSMGDLGVVALFANPDQATLPLQMYRLLAAYRMDEAAAAGLLLVSLAIGIFWLFDRGGGADAES